VPELCRFFGIIIRMYREAGAQHHMPHFHAYYQEDAAIFSIETNRDGTWHVADKATPFGRSLGRASSTRAFDRLATVTQWTASISY
jgi:uncharacterized protein DUF4160